MKRFTLIISGFIMIVLFQNCQQATTFNSTNPVHSKVSSDGSLVPVVSDNDPADDMTAADSPDSTASDDSTSSDDTTASVIQPGSSAGGSVDHPVDHGKKDDYSSPSSDTTTAAQEPAQEDMHHVCILGGPGKSVKLGMENDDLDGQNAVPGVLCMSKHACLDIASQSFTVKGPEFRGYCKHGHSPQVTHISDVELQSKIDAMKATATAQQ